MFPASVESPDFLKDLGWNTDTPLTRKDEKPLTELIRSSFFTRAYMEIMTYVSRHLHPEEYQPDLSVDIVCAALPGDWLETRRFGVALEVSTTAYVSPRKINLREHLLSFRPGH